MLASHPANVKVSSVRAFYFLPLPTVKVIFLTCLVGLSDSSTTQKSVGEFSLNFCKA